MVSVEQLPFVCQTIEVTTENEEQTVSSSHSYPLQISPVSSCYGQTSHPFTTGLCSSPITNLLLKPQTEPVSQDELLVSFLFSHSSCIFPLPPVAAETNATGTITERVYK